MQALENSTAQDRLREVANVCFIAAQFAKTVFGGCDRFGERYLTGMGPVPSRADGENH